MAASHFFVGLSAGVAILAVPVLLFTPGSSVPQHVAEWLEGPAETAQLPGPNENAAVNRPLSGYKAGDPTPAPAAAAPTLQPVARPTATPTRVPAAVAPNPNLAVSTTGLRWAGTGVIHSGGGPVVVRQVAGINARDDPQLPDGSPVLVAVGPPVPMAGEQWRAIRALNGIIGWVPTSQLAVDGEAGPAPTYVAAVGPTAPPQPSPATAPAVARGTIADTGGTGVVLRNSPNAADRSRAGLMDGAGITVLERAGNDWVRVQAGNGATGWVPARYVKAAP